MFVIRGHKRSLEVIKGQMEGKHQNIRKINTMGIVGKVFNCRIQLFEFFVIRGHWRSLEVNKGQMKVKNQNVKKSRQYGYCWKGLQL